ncbi:MAG: lysophospholipid acyltransferase family protein [Clostridia bacterium]|nr:lysophospholipid acyltransferase family protein [Clostridia bacterium]
MPLPQLEQYYREKRKHDFENGKKIKGYTFRKILHPFLWLLVKIDRLITGEKIITLKKPKIKTHKPIIFACTHIGGNDAARALEFIKRHCYLFLGDPKAMYKNFEGLLVYLSGCVIIDTLNKTDRAVGFNRAIELLKAGQNLLIFPEGEWNITENELCMKLYPGVIKMALETGAIVVPMAVEQYDNTFVFNMGDIIDYNTATYKDYSADKLKADLRDRLATLKYQIIEKHPENYGEITKAFRESFAQNIVSRCEYEFSVQECKSKFFRDKNIVFTAEAFAHLKNLIPNKNNLFLFNKRYTIN